MSHLRNFIKCSLENSSKMRWIKQAKSQVLALYYSKCGPWNSSFKFQSTLQTQDLRCFQIHLVMGLQQTCVYAEVLDALSRPTDSWKAVLETFNKRFTT